MPSSRASGGLLSLAPVGWTLTMTCNWCGRLARCYADGELWLCIRDFGELHGFDPRFCEWGAR